MDATRREGRPRPAVRRPAILASLAVVLLFLVAVLGARVVEKRTRTPPRLKPETLRCLAGLRGRLTLTYFGTGKDALPSAMKDVDNAVRLLLDALKAGAPDRIDCRAIDPDVDPQGPAYASRHAVSPIRVRRVLRDESSETPVWSSLAIAYERHPDGLIQGITPADLPHLEDLIVETLSSADHPPHPTVAVAAPQRGYDQVRSLCASLIEEGGRVVPADCDPDIRIPADADLLLWIQPRGPTSRDAVTLERFLATGRSVILAGSTYAIDAAPEKDGGNHYRVARAGPGWANLLRSFGLTQEPFLLLDKTHAEIAWQKDGSPVKVDAPFQFRVLPSCLDTRSLLGPNTGTLLVSAVSATRWDPAALAAAGRRAEIVATTSENASVMELPDDAFDDARLEGGKPVSKQPWLVLLKAQDPWKGDLLVAGSPTLFHDDAYAQGMNANQNFLRTLLRTFTSTQRLARIRVPRSEPARVAPLSLASRLSWRVVTVFLVPAALLLLAVVGARTRPLGSRKAPWRLRAAAGMGAFVIVAALATLVGAVCPIRSDLTEGAVNTPSPSTVRHIDRIRPDLRVELVASEAFRMPPDLKRVELRVLGGLRALGIHPVILRPEDLGDAERRKLQEDGAEPFDVKSVENDAATASRVWSALRLSHAGRTEIIPRIDSRSIEHLDFLVAAAAERLATGRTPLVGILSDLPRLSPAEAHEDYETKGYTAPVGSDVYSDAKQMLQDYGYHVAYINPETQSFPERMDLLVWLQPRYAQKTYPRFAEFMAGGGRAIVALQHYRVEQRQYRGKGFETVYWPQPQFHRFNEYLEVVGLRQIGEKRAEKQMELPGEVLFDRQHADLVLKTEVNRSAFRENDPQQVSRPFLIRAAGEGLSSTSIITSKLGGLMFIWGSRFVLDGDRLARSGISSQTLATTSPRAWTYAWKGGWIPEVNFTEPAELLPGPQPLSVLLEGRFPEAGAESSPASAASRPAASSAPGKLLLVGCSEMFKNDYLHQRGYQHDQFLLNAAAFLTYGPELAEVQARSYTPRILAYQPENVIVEWRILTLALPPLAFILYGIVRALLQRKPVVGAGPPALAGIFADAAIRKKDS